jgi:hypothetical protein
VAIKAVQIEYAFRMLPSLNSRNAETSLEYGTSIYDPKKAHSTSYPDITMQSVEGREPQYYFYKSGKCEAFIMMEEVPPFERIVFKNAGFPKVYTPYTFARSGMETRPFVAVYASLLQDGYTFASDENTKDEDSIWDTASRKVGGRVVLFDTRTGKISEEEHSPSVWKLLLSKRSLGKLETSSV